MKIDTSDKGIIKRVGWVKQFLEELVKETIFKSTEEVFGFLSMDKVHFDQMRNDHSDINVPKSISQIQHMNGKVDIKIVDKKVSLSYNISKYCIDNLSLYKKLKANNKEIVNVMCKLSGLLNTQAEIYKNLSLSNISIKCVEMGKIWNEMKLLNLNQSEYLKAQVELVNEYMHNFLKHLKGHTSSINKVIFLL